MSNKIKRKLFFTGMLIQVFLLSGCVERPILITDYYKDAKISNQSLAIVQLFDEPYIGNPDDIKDDLGTGEAGETYINFFKKEFIKVLENKNSFSDIYYVDNGKFIPGLEARTVNIKKLERMEILLPQNVVKVDDAIIPDFLLFIDNLQVLRSGSREGSIDGLKHKMHFAIWDNNRGRLVSFGRLNIESPFMFGLSKDNGIAGVRNLADEIYLFSPFTQKIDPHPTYRNKEVN